MSVNFYYDDDKPPNPNSKVKLHTARITRLKDYTGLGEPGQFLKNDGDGIISWDYIPIVTPIPGPANSILTTDSSGSTIEWNNDISPTNITLNGSLIAGGTSGLNNFILKSIGSTAEWTNILDVYSVDSVNSNTSILNVGNKIIIGGNTGSAGQVIKNLGSGNVEWANEEPLAIGSANQILTTNAAGTDTEWSNDIKPASITFLNGNDQSSLERYTSNYYDVNLYLCSVGSGTLHYQNLTMQMHYTIIGKQCTIYIHEFEIVTPVTSGGLTSPCYVVIPIQPIDIILPYEQYLPLSSHKQYSLQGVSCIAMNTLQTCAVNVYRNYYGENYGAIEFVLNNAGTYSSGGNHGDGFTFPVAGTFFKLESPFQLTYIIN